MDKKTEALKPCEYCGHPLPQSVDKRTRQVRSHHFDSCKVRIEQKALEEQPAQQEPVALGYMNAGYVHEMQQGRLPYGYVYPKEGVGASVAVYTSPPASKPFIWLTNAEIAELKILPGANRERTATEMAFAIIDKLKDKNGY